MESWASLFPARISSRAWPTCFRPPQAPAPRFISWLQASRLRMASAATRPLAATVLPVGVTTDLRQSNRTAMTCGWRESTAPNVPAHRRQTGEPGSKRCLDSESPGSPRSPTLPESGSPNHGDFARLRRFPVPRSLLKTRNSTASYGTAEVAAEKVFSMALRFATSMPAAERNLLFCNDLRHD